jgi:ubiquitin carboxyl-terminal hydrolase 8
VRDASSRAERPKWYKGEVKRVAAESDKLRNIEKGAELETFEIPGETKKKALLLLNRTQQILVEVEQERANIPAVRTISIDESESMDTMTPQPPFLRWVSLYGEEVCEAGTHMKVLKEKHTPVVTLRYEYEADRQPVEIMKSFNNMYGPGFMKESLHGTPPAPGSVGMHNLGNSCFLNSIVQCLNHIEPLTLYFMKGAYMKDLNRANPLGSGGRVATAYAGLLREMWGGKFSALAPRMLKQTVAMFAPQFNNSYQHDSQEFCQFLMDGLHEDCNRVKSKPYVEELEGFGMEDEIAAIETWRKHLLRHDSVIVDCFQGMHRSHLTCPSCGRESIKFDVFSTISLPLAHGKERSVVNLYDCLDKFMEGEQLDDLNAWYCPNCKKHVCALKMIALWSAPDILILHLKRFTFDHCAKSNQVVRSKVDDRVLFPIDGLDLRKHALGPHDEDAPPIYNVSISPLANVSVWNMHQSHALAF